MEQFFVFVGEQWLLVSILIALVFGYFWTEGTKAGKVLSSHAATLLINSGEAHVLDVREAKEYKLGSIVKNATHIPHNRVVARISELEPHKGKTILLVDQMGHHAAAVGRSLRAKGFEVSRLQGGIAEWTNQKLPLVK